RWTSGRVAPRRRRRCRSGYYPGRRQPKPDPQTASGWALLQLPLVEAFLRLFPCPVSPRLSRRPLSPRLFRRPLSPRLFRRPPSPRAMLAPLRPVAAPARWPARAAAPRRRVAVTAGQDLDLGSAHELALAKGSARALANLSAPGWPKRPTS